MIVNISMDSKRFAELKQNSKVQLLQEYLLSSHKGQAEYAEVPLFIIASVTGKEVQRRPLCHTQHSIVVNCGTLLWVSVRWAKIIQFFACFQSPQQADVRRVSIEVIVEAVVPAAIVFPLLQGNICHNIHFTGELCPSERTSLPRAQTLSSCFRN